MSIRFLILLSLLFASSTSVLAAQDFTWHGKVAAGKAIEIKGINGGIKARAASGNEVEVTAVKRARRSDPASVKIAVVQHDDGVTICAVYPGKSSEGENTCAPGKDGHMDVKDNDVTVEFSVAVPAGVRFAAHTVNGGIEANDLDARVEAATVNGGITLSTRGTAEAATVNGGVTASLGQADWKGETEFVTVNGSVTVTLPATLSVEVEASTVNGSIDSDFPLLIQGRISPRKITGTIGSGGRTLKLHTVNGSIRLRKGT